MIERSSVAPGSRRSPRSPLLIKLPGSCPSCCLPCNRGCTFSHQVIELTESYCVAHPWANVLKGGFKGAL